MSEVFFIADTHFGHKRIVEFSETKPFRPFASIDEHDEELVRRWNATVGKKDTVWHLGDFAFNKRGLRVADRLNGRKKLVMGNHDLEDSDDYLQYFTRLAGIVEYKDFVLSHAPLHESQLKRWPLNVHGHLHARSVKRHTTTHGEIEDLRYLCVSCEQVDLTPVSYEWVMSKWAERKEKPFLI